MASNKKNKIIPTTFIVPIRNLEFLADWKKEIKICHVTFIEYKKLTRCYRRFKINEKISELRKKGSLSFFFKEPAKAYGIIRQPLNEDTPQEFVRNCINIVTEELSILTSSMLGMHKRKKIGNIQIQGESIHDFLSYAIFNSKNFKAAGFYRSREVKPLQISKDWHNFQKQRFFYLLLKILNNRKISSNWRKELYRSAILIGRSYNTSHRATAFLYNMIAIETLLLDCHRDFPETITLQMEGFLGWLDKWNKNAFREGIVKCYKARNSFVHNGDETFITKDLLLFTDDLISNILENIVFNIKIFNSKKAIIDFSNKIKAETLLGLKTNIRPKKLRYVSRLYFPDDLKDI